MPSGSPKIDYWVAPVDDTQRVASTELAARLRALGASVEYPLKAQALGKQFKAANSAGARAVIIVGAALSRFRRGGVQGPRQRRSECLLADVAVRPRPLHRRKRPTVTRRENARHSRIGRDPLSRLPSPVSRLQA
ncbi:MAG: His/Gly/Thr/Pro-type tRNA ligase C-terminal domain-containing protein [Gemmatimonadaceae bacterium]